MNRPVFYLALFGGVVGTLVAYQLDRPELSISPLQYAPLPHQVPKYPGGVSLRFAMVHDVVHERFPKHGPDYYRERSRAARKRFEQFKANPPATTRPIDSAEWALLDDIAVGHVHLGEFDAAIALMRDKLARQERLNITGGDLYPTYANLGTALMIDALVKAQAGKDSADELRESLTWVRKSVEVNPQAHFGREVWQVVLGEFLLDAQRDPTLLLKYDMIGNALVESDGHFDAFLLRGHQGSAYGGSPFQAPVPRRLLNLLDRQPGYEKVREQIRDGISRVGAQENWTKDTHTSLTKPVPFDEPVLGIIGMWRYGGGANPHFSLALAETMVRVGQLHIAWAAYERTARLVGENSALGRHCFSRRQEIELHVPERPEELHAAFDADLKAGLAYQAAYQKYESDRIAAGVSVDDPHFYDAFLAKHGDIASDPAHADDVLCQPRDGFKDALPSGVFGAGLAGLVTALVKRSRRHRL